MAARWQEVTGFPQFLRGVFASALGVQVHSSAGLNSVYSPSHWFPYLPDMKYIGVCLHLRVV
jgi:hypothetical protein